MRTSPALMGLPLLLLIAACAQSGEVAPAGPEPAPSNRSEAFEQRATEVAEAWRAAVGPDKWRKGFVPLQDPTVLPADPGFSGETKQAFLAGWYRSTVSLPAAKPADSTVRFPDGTLSVPLVSAQTAYRDLDQGDPPPCSRPSPAAPADKAASTTDPNAPVSSAPSTACTALTVTAVKLGTASVRTSRGDASVPAWIFTIKELKSPVARVAVAPGAVTPLPSASAPAAGMPESLVGAQDLTGVDGAKLGYRLGVGACDKDITPLVQEYDDVIVVGGAVQRSDQPCTTQLLLHPVTVTLDRPVDARPVLDAGSGQPLILSTTVR